MNGYRILNGFNLVETDTVAILGDDDILDPKGLSDCVTFLERNADYSVVHGQYIGFNLTPNGLGYNRTYQSSSIEQKCPLDRLFCFFSSYSAPSIYAVNRTARIRYSFEELCRNNTDFVSNFVSVEIMASAIPLLKGKLKRIDSFYLARRFLPSVPGRYAMYYARFIFGESFSEHYNNLKCSITRHIPAVEEIDMDTASDALDFTFAAFFGQRISTNEMRARFQALNVFNK